METVTENTNVDIEQSEIVPELKTIPLDTRMKMYESQFESIINPYESYIVRMDGRSFSTFTKGFKKPFDMNFINAMRLTAKDLIKKFNPQTVYFHSDEFTLCFDSLCTKDEYDKLPSRYSHIFNGRVCKIITTYASYCSVRFNYHINNIMAHCENISDYSESFIKSVQAFDETFDARVLRFDESQRFEMVNHQIWRSIRDSHRNAVNTYGQTFIGKKQILDKNQNQIIEMLKNVGIDWETVPLFIKYGIYCKGIYVENTNETNNKQFIRKDYVFFQHRILPNDESLNMLCSKVINSVEYFDVIQDNAFQ